jgi:ABC-2 type transport system permease protein
MKGRVSKMNTRKILWGVLCYEFLMQIRRPALWLAFLIFALLDFRGVIGQISFYKSFPSIHFSTLQWAAFLAVMTNWLVPLGVGILLADRLPRDRRTRVEEVFNSLPGTLKTRVLGKYLGTLLATLVPSFLLYAVNIAIATWQLNDPGIIPASLLCYVLVVLPGMCFIAAFSLALPVVIWVPLYQFLFFGYWFWGNILAPGYGLPTLSGTILTPIGSAIATGLFGVPAFGQAQSSASVVYGMSSMVALLGISVLVLIALYQFLKLEQARQ